MVDFKHINTNDVDTDSIYTDPFITLNGGNSFSTLIQKHDIPNSQINMGTDRKGKKFVVISMIDNRINFINRFFQELRLLL